MTSYVNGLHIRTSLTISFNLLNCSFCWNGNWSYP